jgi:CubicO group peptidase (beta-lactamase class C family)
MSGCENPFFYSKKSESKKTTKIKEAKKEKLQKNKEIIEKKMKDYLVANNISGSIFVKQNDNIYFNEGLGYANKEKKILNQPSTTYPIGSITKVFVATSIMKLQEQNKLNIQDPVAKYIPNFPNGDNIKLYNFLTHTSGIHRLLWHKGDVTPSSLIQEIERQPVQFQPGQKWDYLDANYIALGFIIEKVTGTPLHDFIQKNILDIVPLKETGFMTHEHPIPYNSVGYLTKDNKLEPTVFFNIPALFGCGDIYSTASDLSKFDQALMSGKLISKDSLIQMTTPSSKSLYGLGLYNNGKFVYSRGVLGGFDTMHSYYTDKTSIVVFLNTRDLVMKHIDEISGNIYQMVVDTLNPPKP